jgi:hypothetical protein
MTKETEIECPFCEGINLVFHPKDEECWAYFSCPECEAEFISCNGKLELCADLDAED